MTDPATLAFYDRDAAQYAALRATRSRPQRVLQFAERLPPGSSVLDLGCGGGHDSAVLLERGFRVTSVDASPGLAAEAKRHCHIDVRLLSFDQLDYDAAFQGVWASASLHHVQTSALPAILSAIHRALAPGGQFSASLKVGPDRRDKLGRFYCAMDEASLAHLMSDRAQWTEVRIALEDGSGHDGEAVQWLLLDARRSS